MSADAWLTCGIIVAAILAMAFEIASFDLLMFSAVILLMLLGVLRPEDALAGFGSTTVWTIGALLVVAAGVRATGVLSLLADAVLGPRPKKPLLRLMLPIATTSAFLNNTPIVAMFVPAIIDWCKRNNLAPSRLLMPLSFATVLGGTCSLIGTSTNLVVDGLMRQSGMGGLAFFELAGVGVPSAVLGLLLIGILARRLLPDRRDPVTELTEGRREYLVEMLVETRSPLVGQSVADAGLRNLPGLYLMAIEREGRLLRPVRPSDVVRATDRLVFAGIASTVVDLQRFPGLTPAPEAHYDPIASIRRGHLFEVVVSQGSPLVGSTIKDVGFRSRYDAAVIAVHRAGHRLTTKIGDVELRPGDTLMIEAAPDFRKLWGDSRDFVLVSKVQAAPLPRRRKALAAVLILAAMVFAVGAGLLPMVVAALVASAAMVMLGLLSVREAQRSLDLGILLGIGSALAMSRALEVSGAAEGLAGMFGMLQPYFGPTGVLAGAFLATMLLTQVVSNAGAAAMVFPIAIAAAQNAGLDPRPFAIAIAIGGSTCFMTPTGDQTNLMVYGPGGYRFTDFTRLGGPLSLLVFVVAMVVVPRLWPL